MGSVHLKAIESCAGSSRSISYPITVFVAIDGFRLCGQSPEFRTNVQTS